MRTEHCQYAKLKYGKCVAICHRIAPASGIDCIGNFHSTWVSKNFREVEIGHFDPNEDRAVHGSTLRPEKKKYKGVYI